MATGWIIPDNIVFFLMELEKPFSIRDKFNIEATTGGLEPVIGSRGEDNES